MNGIICLDKPEGFTSFDAVAKLRGLLKTKKIGHSGTLDPMATGVLVTFVGNATKAIQFLPDSTKSYVATVTTGIKTDTGDRTGEVIARGEPILDMARIRECAARFIGKTMQTPPMYSAVKINGERLYKLARAGLTAEVPAREIEITRLDIAECESGVFTLLVDCSAGTYIRTLAEDLCEAAGGLGTLKALRRTRSGRYSLADCVGFGAVGEGALRPVSELFSGLPVLTLDGELWRLFINGVKLGVARVGAAKNTRYAVRGEGCFALAQTDESSLVKLAAFTEGL